MQFLESGKAAVIKALVFVILPATLAADSFTLTNTISLGGVNFQNIATDGTNLLVLGSGSLNEPIYVYSTSGQLLETYQTGLSLDALTSTGTDVIAVDANGNLVQISLPNGPTSGALAGTFAFANGLGFDGTNLLLTSYAQSQGIAGNLTVLIQEINPVTFADAGTDSVTI
jgi:hypothetical protein